MSTQKTAERVAIDAATVGFDYDPASELVTIEGVKFTREFFQHLGKSTSIDECYRHVTREDGVVTVTRTLGHECELRELRAVARLRPEPGKTSYAEFEEWVEKLDQVLGRQGSDFADASVAHEMLLDAVEAFHNTVREENQRDLDQEEIDRRQREAAAVMFVRKAELQRLRHQLFPEEVA